MTPRISILVALAVAIVSRDTRADDDGAPLSSSGMVLVGPRLIAVDGEAVAIWIEEPKTLVAARLDRNARVVERLTRELPAPDAPVRQIVPMLVDASGDTPFTRVAVVLLEHGVTRVGEPAPFARVSVHRLDGPPARTQIVAEGPDDGTGAAPAAIVGVGAHTAARLPAVIWRKGREERNAERRGAPATLSILRPDRTSDSDILGEARTATAAAWRSDGAALLAVSDAGRPLVVAPSAEHVVDVPTPATLSTLLVPERGNIEWVAAGLDACRRLFVVAATVHSSPTRSFFLPVAPLVDAPPDLADAGVVLGLPLLVTRAAGVSLIWPARVAGIDQLRVRDLTTSGGAVAPSASLLSCPDGTRAVAADAVDVRGALIAAMTCARGGRADVRATAFGGSP